MASLNKLAIRGIRSFDDKQISVIEFFSPVTVIVGHNGSGKTTIIECLKYATTGDQPPNTRGGAFVHDPKMAAEKEVKAQVKLRFNAANGQRMIATRNLSVTTKKGAGLAMKTLESVLALADGNESSKGKRNAISTKCAEMDVEIPQLLGVSKSVLENVIFCHQEESYWPLAEPSALKKKFDDIFEATKYTKALDSIKALRKERVADLKAEKERLESLSKDKANADKLKSRIEALTTTIANKEIEYEETKKKYDAIVEANQKFYEQANKFRDMYSRVESLNEQIDNWEKDIAQSKADLRQEITGTIEELQQKLNNFKQDLDNQRELKKDEVIKLKDLDDQMTELRDEQSRLLQQQGSLNAAADVHRQRIEEREKEMKDLSDKFGFKGFHNPPFEGPKVLEFMTKLEDVKKQSAKKLETLQEESRAASDEYTRKFQELNAAVEKHRATKKTLSEQMSHRRARISQYESQLEQLDKVQADLEQLQGDMEEKRSRFNRLSNEGKEAKYEERLAQSAKQLKELEERRDELNDEFRNLNGQSNARAKLNVKRDEIKKNQTEIKQKVDAANSKFKQLSGGKQLVPETMVKDIEQLLREKEHERDQLDKKSSSATYALQQLEFSLDSTVKQLKAKKDEIKVLDKQLQENDKTLEEDTADSLKELNHRQSIKAKFVGNSTVFANILEAGKKRRICAGCNRPLKADEMKMFEAHLNEQIARASPERQYNNEEELREWEGEYQRLLNLKPVQMNRNRLRDEEVPSLQDEIKKQEAQVAEASSAAEEVGNELENVKSQLKDLQLLKQHAASVRSLQESIENATSEIKNLEEELAVSGSTKTIEEVGEQLEDLKKEYQTRTKERTALSNEHSRHNQVFRNLENELLQMKVTEAQFDGKLKDKRIAETEIENSKKDIDKFSREIKEADSLISQGQAPIDRLTAEHHEHQEDYNAKIAQAQKENREINFGYDRIRNANDRVERYVKERGEERLEKCNQGVARAAKKIEEVGQDIEALRQVIARLEKAINESDGTTANIRENLRLRKVEEDIKKAKEEIASCDVEEAARARRIFKEKYKVVKEEETSLGAKTGHLAGELSSQKNQLKVLESDLTEYKTIQKDYTEQLIKVKMSDMANSDLEKYAKALDNAIMKYHGLKMEEVNDIMRHLWNKTYQGTDIDGIKIRSDVEGGASKRSYNYRVVMTKDQVEMDMRGRCSAGQKMLASIIIRLALSDSFGQNCGILALDEPTNALDTENIDALANSLVDIINERKNQSNFQLIIITHDENFLRKLGQGEVMEYYWRVSRDARQKSVIERQRFR